MRQQETQCYQLNRTEIWWRRTLQLTQSHFVTVQKQKHISLVFTLWKNGCIDEQNGPEVTDFTHAKIHKQSTKETSAWKHFSQNSLRSMKARWLHEGLISLLSTNVKLWHCLEGMNTRETGIAKPCDRCIRSHTLYSSHHAIWTRNLRGPLIYEIMSQQLFCQLMETIYTPMWSTITCVCRWHVNKAQK